MEVASIVLASVSLVASIIAPVVMATALFINRIRKSDCCGAHLELDKQNSSNQLDNQLGKVIK